MGGRPAALHLSAEPEISLKSRVSLCDSGFFCGVFPQGIAANACRMLRSCIGTPTKKARHSGGLQSCIDATDV